MLLFLEGELHNGLDAVVEYPVEVGRRVLVGIRLAVMDGGEHILDTELQFAEVVPFGRSASFCPVGPRLYFGVLFYR